MTIGLQEIPAGALVLLQASGAMDRPHSGRTLHRHLTGTFELLRAWGNPSHVCFAGLFHSVYGTNAFRHQSLAASDRGRVQAAIGCDAEALAWTFGHIDRPGAILRALRDMRHAPSSLQEDERAHWRALAAIESANLIEQGDRGRALRELYCAAIDAPGTLTVGAVQALKQALTGHATHRQRVPAHD